MDEQQVNLTRFNLFFPEKREFFLEGRGIFDFARGSFRTARILRRDSVSGTGDAPTLFYSRRIGLQDGRVVPILGGGRLTGKAGAFDVGMLSIQTDDETASSADDTSFTVLRVKADILRRSSIGAILTHRSVSLTGDGSNQTYGATPPSRSSTTSTSSATTPGPAPPASRAATPSYQARFDYGADRYGFELDHLLVEKNFRPEIGFLRRDKLPAHVAVGPLQPAPRDPSSRCGSSSSRRPSTTSWTADTAALETRQTQVAFQTELENSDQFGVRLSDSYELLHEPFSPGGGIAIPAGGYGFHRRAPDLRPGPPAPPERAGGGDHRRLLRRPHSRRST